MADNLTDAGARVGEHGRAMRDEAKAAVADVRSAVGDTTSRIKDTAGNYASQAKDYAQKGYRFAVEKGKKAKDSTEGFIQDHPWYAVGIALGAGMLLGMLLRGRSGGSSDD